MSELRAEDMIILNNKFNDLTELSFKPREQMLFYTILSYLNDLEDLTDEIVIDVENLKNKSYMYKSKLNWDFKRLIEDTLVKIQHNLFDVKEKRNKVLFEKLDLTWTKQSKFITVKPLKESKEYFHIKDDDKYFKIRLSLLNELKYVNQRKAYRLLEQWNDSISNSGFYITNERFIDVVLADNITTFLSGMTENRFTKVYLQKIISSLSHIFKEIEVSYISKTSNIFDGSLNVKYVRFDSKSLNEYAKSLRSDNHKQESKITYKYVNEDSIFESIEVTPDKIEDENYTPKTKTEKEVLKEEKETLNELKLENDKFVKLPESELELAKNARTLKSITKNLPFVYGVARRFALKENLNEYLESVKEYELGTLHHGPSGTTLEDSMSMLTKEEAKKLLKYYQDQSTNDYESLTDFNRDYRIDYYLESAILSSLAHLYNEKYEDNFFSGEVIYNGDRTLQSLFGKIFLKLYEYIDNYGQNALLMLLKDLFNITIEDAKDIQGQIFNIAENWYNQTIEASEREYEIYEGLKTEERYEALRREKNRVFVEEMQYIMQTDEEREELEKLRKEDEEIRAQKMKEYEAQAKEPNSLHPDFERFNRELEEKENELIEVQKKIELISEAGQKYREENEEKARKESESDRYAYLAYLKEYEKVTAGLMNLKLRAREIMQEEIPVARRNAEHGYDVSGYSDAQIEHIEAVDRLAESILN